jgi:hypothetical protein
MPTYRYDGVVWCFGRNGSLKRMSARTGKFYIAKANSDYSKSVREKLLQYKNKHSDGINSTRRHVYKCPHTMENLVEFFNKKIKKTFRSNYWDIDSTIKACSNDMMLSFPDCHNCRNLTVNLREVLYEYNQQRQTRHEIAYDSEYPDDDVANMCQRLESVCLPSVTLVQERLGGHVAQTYKESIEILEMTEFPRFKCNLSFLSGRLMNTITVSSHVSDVCLLATLDADAVTANAQRIRKMKKARRKLRESLAK